jgi:hypothetical protein
VKRSWLRPVSDPRQVAMVKRRHAMIEKFGEPEEWCCQLWMYLAELVVFNGKSLPGNGPSRCFGAVHGHELLKRSRGGSITDYSTLTSRRSTPTWNLCE